MLVDQKKYVLEKVKSVCLEKGRRENHSSLASDVERRSFTTLVYQLIWGGKETRPEAASLLAARVKAPAIGYILKENAAAQLLRSTAALEIIVWKFDFRNMQLIAVSDCSGAGIADGVRDQGAWLILAAQGDLQTGVSAKVTPVAWRSTRLRRLVSCTLAGEMQAPTQVVYELQWLQLQLQDATSSNIVSRGWEGKMLPYAIAVPSGAELCAESAPHVGSKQDRRTAAARAVVRWITHPYMPVGIMTKSDVRRGNAALTCLLRTGRCKLLCEEQEVSEGRVGKAKPGRSHHVSERLRRGAW